MFRKIKRYIRSPYYEIGRDIMQRWPHIMSDKWFIKVQYLNELGCKVNLKEPRSFTEKMQWFKLYDHNPLYTTLVDKYRVKEWITGQLGPNHVLPTLAVWDYADKIDIRQLPNQFVLKCNHDCGSVIICKDKASFDLDNAKQKLATSLNRNHYHYGREWPYKNVKPLIIAEPFISDSPDTDLLTDYKFFCFNGKPTIMMILSDRQTEIKMDVYDMDFQPLPTRQKSICMSSGIRPKPVFWDDMIDCAKTLSKELPVCRVDMYYAENNPHTHPIIIGEMTLFDGAGYDPFVPEEWNIKIGDMIELPRLKH